MAGIFTYGSTRVNLLQLAANNGQVATLDPTVGKLMGDIRTAVAGTGITNLTDPNEQRSTFSNSAKGLRYYPTLRGDYNLSQGNRLTGTYNRQVYHSTPDTLNSADPAFPGFPIQGSQNSVRVNWTTALRSTLSPNMVNEVHGGYTNSFVTFFPEVTADAFANASVGNA